MARGCKHDAHGFAMRPPFAWGSQHEQLGQFSELSSGSRDLLLWHAVRPRVLQTVLVL
jgi:hypothetical protein